MASKQLLVCDLDNTLYDWVAYFVPSFYAMVDAATQIIGCDKEELLDDFRQVHQRHGDSEHPFALLETRSVIDRYAGWPVESILQELDPAFHAFNSARKENLKLHPHVRETLDLLTAADIKIVAHTESKLYGVVDRLSRLDLFRYFSRVYCRERSQSRHPSPKSASDWLARMPAEKIVELSHNQTKPDPTVLLEICSREGADREAVAYIGDSIARDILMAKRANVPSIWAKYGARHAPGLYEKLVRVSHWTSEEVAREISLREEARSIKPDFIAQTSFVEVLAALDLRRSVHRISV